MADYAALREAEDLVKLADDIAARIAAELRAMEQACQRARENSPAADRLRVHRRRPEPHRPVGERSTPQGGQPCSTASGAP